MDVQKINKTTFQTDGLVENWDSMIWTERHSDLGDFSLKTPYVKATMDKIPEGSLISIRGSDEVCMVDTHSIGTDGLLTTVGRSVEGFLENRCLTGPYREPWPLPGLYTVQDAILTYIWNSIVNPHSYEIIRDYAWDHNLREVLPNVSVSDSTKALKAVVGSGSAADLQTLQEWWFDVGDLLSHLQDMLTLGNLGIRIIRPRSLNAKIVDNIDSAVAGNWAWYRVITKTVHPTVDTLRFDIYNGRNRTVDSATATPLDINSPVIFSYLNDIDDPNYLFSIKDWKSCVHMQSPFQSVEVYAGATGWDHRMEWVDSGDLDDSLSDADFLQALKDKALAEYKKKQALRMIDGGISATANWRYGIGKDYYLGDIVSVLGNYGISEPKMVSEFIRTADKTGEKAYPTLIDPP